jgi:membrane-associated protease RseP (regulator of RpoE activity)
MNRYAIFAAVAIGLSGCVSPSQMFVNPQGQVMRCSASGWGWAGAPLANSAFNKCVDDMTAIGYAKLETVGLVGIQLTRSEASPPLVQVVSPGSPAAVAGILAGDELYEVDNQAVNSSAAANQALFGDVGKPVNLKLRRSGKELQVTIVRAARVKPTSS